MTSQRVQQAIKQRLANDIRSHSISLCWVNNCYDNNPQEDSLTVGELIDRFSKPDLLRGKLGLGLADYLALDKTIPEEKECRDAEKNGEGFIPASFKRSRTKRADDVATIYAFVLDLDGGVTLEEFQQKLSGYAYLAHTSYSHSEHEERWRVIVFYEIPCTPDQHAAVFAHFNAMFDGRIDSSSKKLSQLWYTPACPPDAVHLFQSFFNDAMLFNPYSVGTVSDQKHTFDTLKALVKGTTHAANEATARTFIGDRIHSTSPDPNRVCCDGERTEHLTRLAGMWIGSGYRLDDVKKLSLGWNSRNTPPLDDNKVVATCDGIYSTHFRNHGQAERPDITEISPLFSIDAYRAGRFLDKPPPEQKWVLVNFLPAGIVGIAVAPGGTGKSWFLTQLGASVATGLTLAGVWEVGTTGSVLMLSAEDDEDQLHRRLARLIEQLGADATPDVIARLREKLIIVPRVGEDNLLTSTDPDTREVGMTLLLQRLIAAAEQIPDLVLIIIDPASRFRGGNENAAEDVTRFIEALERLARATGATVLVAHHANKGAFQATEQNQSASRGSSALTDGARWQFNLMTFSEKEAQKYGIPVEEKGFYLTTAITKNNYSAPQPPVILKRGEGGYLHRADLVSTKAVQADNLSTRIVALVVSEMKDNRKYSKSAFANQFGGKEGVFKVGNNALRDALAALIKADRLLDEGGKLAPPKRARIPIPHGKTP